MSAVAEQARPKVSNGEIIANKFRVDRMLGSGGTGFVVLATHLQLDERVALKFLHDSSDAERLAQEARACLKLKTEHVARVKDIGRHGDMPFIVMEYLEGKDLQALLEENGKLEDAGEAVELVVQICEALAEAHRAGIVHRDVKLSNLYFVASRSSVPVVKLLDFGIATAVAAGRTKKLGTLHYMSPESLQGVDSDPRSDLWSLGVVLFELLTGWKPFDSKDVVSLVAEIGHEPHLALRSYRPDLPEELEQIIDRCLEKDPTLRYQSAGELASALQPFAPARALANIERAAAWSRSLPPPSSQPTMSVTPAPPSGPVSVTERVLRTSGNLRASGARAMRDSRARASSTLPMPAEPAPTSKIVKLAVWAIAGSAVVGLVAILSMRQGREEAPAAAPAATTAAAAAAAAPAGTPEAAPAASPATAAAAATTHAPPASSPAAKAGFAPAAPRGGRAVAPTAPPTPAATPVAPATTSAAAPPPTANATSKGLEKDPWHSNKPKLEDSPFK